MKRNRLSVENSCHWHKRNFVARNNSAPKVTFKVACSTSLFNVGTCNFEHDSWWRVISEDKKVIKIEQNILVAVNLVIFDHPDLCEKGNNFVGKECV